jgi:taurine--2-oxoglutarate transaminase
VKNKSTKEPLAPYGGGSPAMSDVLQVCKDLGLIPFSNNNRIHIVPPCTTTPSEAREGLAILDQALTRGDSYTTKS